MKAGVANIGHNGPPAHLLLVDCSAFAYRAYYSFPAMRRDSDGEPVGAVVGFMAMMWRLLGAALADPLTFGVAVFDAPGKTFRDKLYPRYKSNRDPARSLELENQLPIMRPVAEVLGLTVLERKGFEADDVIATLADKARKAGIRTTIVSSDKDFAQLVVDGWIEIVDPMQRARDPDKSARRLEADVVAKFGVPPNLVPDVQALAGDAVDGIPGISGLGIERAASLVRRFGSLEGVLANWKECRWAKARIELHRHADDARLFLKLTTLRRNVPGKIDFAAFKMRPIMRADIEAIMKKLGAESRIEEIFRFDPQMERPANPSADPFEWWREERAVPGQRMPDEPQCGFYQRRIIHKGPWVPARIWRDKNEAGAEILRCEVDGKPRDPKAEWVRLAMQPITEEQYRFMTADSSHAKAFRPGDPKATPNQPIDIMKHAAPRNPKAKQRISS